MPKTNTNYQNRLQLRISDKFLMLINNSRRSKGARKGFGTVPNQAEFIRGAIYYWVRKNAPEMLELNGEIPEVIEHKKFKDEEIHQLSESQKLYEKYFRNRKGGDKS